MNKPQMKSEIAIRHKLKVIGIIYFVSTPDIAHEIKQFGTLLDDDKHEQNEHALLVDPRFDFDEVVAYIENYHKDVNPETVALLDSIDLKGEI